MKRLSQSLKAVWRFYYDGFRQMTWGRTLWIIIIVKLIVLFLVLRLFFFRPTLSGQNDAEKQQSVGRELSEPKGRR